MGKSALNKKQFCIISGLSIRDNNRGTAALGYGAITFMLSRHFLFEGQDLLNLKFVRFPWKYKDSVEEIFIQGKKWNLYTIYISSFEKRLFFSLHLYLPFSKLYKIKSNISCVAAINGGDGFSDIYNTQTFRNRLPETLFAMNAGVPLILLPQTLGPFEQSENCDLARKILLYSNNVFVRDNNFVPELEKMGVKYELTNDLSAFMSPEPWNIKIEKNAVGLNVSGLAYSNSFRALAGQFDAYRELIDKLIEHFQQKGNVVYLIPHSYHYGVPELNNDDMEACQLAFNRLKSKKNVILINKDLISPQIKYLISQMSFFIGTRMHANFAAIFTKTPLFGLAYSYKFQGAFERNGIYNRTVMINNISYSEINGIIEQIDNAYTMDLVNKNK